MARSLAARKAKVVIVDKPKRPWSGLFFTCMVWAVGASYPKQNKALSAGPAEIPLTPRRLA